MDAVRIQVWLLRLTGLGEMLAFGAAVLPSNWIVQIHAWLGLGELPREPVVWYLARSQSVGFGLHGLLLWLLATDVKRYRPLVVFTAYAFLALGPAYLLIDIGSGMPLWWTAVDAWPCLLFGVALLWLDRQASRLAN